MQQQNRPAQKGKRIFLEMREQQQKALQDAH